MEAAGGRRLGMRQFLLSSRLRERDVYLFFPCWNDVLRAAGVESDFWGEPVKSELMLADWGNVARKLQRIPNYKTYGIHGKFYPSTLSDRFGGWSRTPGGFREFASGKEEWKDVLALVESAPESGTVRRARPPGPGRPARSATRKWMTGRQRRQDDGFSFGGPLDMAAMRNAPVNENGVIFLFGIVAERLGFQVEAVRSAFPDCLAKRQVGAAEWRNIRIEFEYESRNFRDHGHAVEECDLIVCWVHNWAECPPELEVIKAR